MTAEFARRSDRVVVELDLLDAVALGGLLQEVGNYGPAIASPSATASLGSVADLQRLGADVASWDGRPVELTLAAARSWLRALELIGEHLATSLSVEDLPAQQRVALVAHWAVDSPMRTAARAYLWTSELVDQLGPLCVTHHQR